MATPLKIPLWRQEQEPVWIACRAIEALPEIEEHVVQFMANGELYTAFVPSRFVNLDKRAIAGQIIADIDEGILVDIPTETLNSGPRIIVTNSERNEVLV